MIDSRATNWSPASFLYRFGLCSAILRRRPGYRVEAHPLNEHFSTDCASSHTQDRMFLFVRVGNDLMLVQYQEHFHGRVTNPLVAVHERVIHDERVSKRYGLLGDGWVEVFATKRHRRLSDCRLQQAEVSDACRPTRLLQDESVQFEDFIKGQVADHASRR